ncbi:hypothetical protein K503DRAFT_693120, partial [Rhizopogon vinicolor AM-OR11-026]
ALRHLMTYLACLRQSRLRRNWSDASVYGISSDGFDWTIVHDRHGGTVKVSREFDSESR